MNEIEYSPFSMLDDSGRVFFMSGKVFRGISRNAVPAFKKLLGEPFFIELMEKGLIPKTRKAEIQVKEYELVLEHEKLLNTLQHEWTFSMFKNAALTILEIQSVCNKYGYELKDAHTLNVLFRGNQAVYVDIGSFRRKRDIWWAQYEFIRCFYIPLGFWAEGKYYITRKLLESNFYRMQTIPDEDIMDSGLLDVLNGKPFKYGLFLRYRKIISTKNKSTILEMLSRLCNRLISTIKRRPSTFAKYDIQYPGLKQLKDTIENLNFPESSSLWKNYHTKFYGKDGKLTSSERFKRIIEIIKELKTQDSIDSVLDLAGNEGLLSFLIKQELDIPKVTLSDYDENALEKAYWKQEALKTDVNIVLLNFMFTPNVVQTSGRLRSDLVLALAVTHHLLLTSKYLISAIFERIKLYSSKYVMIEFMPYGLWSIENPKEPDVPDWYTVEWFENEFTKYFDLILSEPLEQNRILFVGKIKEFK